MSACSLAPATSAGRLLGRLIGQWGVPFGYERSFRVCHGAVLRRRFLASFCTESLAPGAHAKVLDVCRQLGMPGALHAVAAAELHRARFVHFGCEGDGASTLYKVYFEQPIDPGRATPGVAVLLHRAFKWDPGEPSRVALTEYHWHPGLATGAMLDRMIAVYGASAGGESYAIARDVLRTAEARLTRGSLRYLEVSEAGNPRRSFDVNLYDSALLMRDLAPMFERISAVFRLPAGALDGIVAAHATKVVGHWAGGIHRRGDDFFNVYFGVEERRGWAEDAEW